MKYFMIGVCLCQLWVGQVSAGTFTLLSGEKLTFGSEKEFVAIMLEEFLPPDFVGESGFFITSDRSEEKASLRKLLAQTEELTISEANPTTVYPSLDAVLQSAEYAEWGKNFGYGHVFAVEIALKVLDMIAVYRLPSPQTRGMTQNETPEIIIDATGEGEFRVLEE
jgi:hypothetical protein